MDNKYNDYLKLNVYQIYPKSFKDSNGDGIGDLGGIISKVDYLYDLGINAIWICPIYPSPMDDNGYDISDYYDIAKEYGTLDDLKLLIKKLHEKGMKLIMDFVANHTSTSHKWFIESRKGKDNYYSDFYVWKDTKNEHKSIFGGSAWEFDDLRKQYYLHSFCISQADLNFDNPNVRGEMRKIIDYWVAFGVDGFRCDVIDMISKDLDNDIYGNGPNLHKYINELFKGTNLFTVGECSSKNIIDIKNKIDSSREELVTLFQFDHIDVSRKSKFIKGEPKLYEYRNVLSNWVKAFQENDLIYTLFTDNHDQSFMLSRFFDFNNRYLGATLLASMTYLLRGIPFIYQGIEYGSMNSEYSDINDFNDIESINYYNEQIKHKDIKEVIDVINFGGRDNPRRPMAFDGSKFGGFSDKASWIAPSKNLSTINLEKDLKSDKSIFRFYQKILWLRNLNEALTIGSFIDHSYDNNSFIYERKYKDTSFIVICNFDEENRIPYKYINGEIVLSNYNKERYKEEFLPYEVRIIRIS